MGYELLGSDNNVGFKTPLATLHAFNGWADLFLTTPNAGLTDLYAKATANLPAQISLIAFYHQFKTDVGNTDLGDEIDLQLARKLGQYTTATLKFASFNRDAVTLPDVTKLWLQLDFAF